MICVSLQPLQKKKRTASLFGDCQRNTGGDGDGAVVVSYQVYTSTGWRAACEIGGIVAGRGRAGGGGGRGVGGWGGGGVYRHDTSP